MNGFNSILNTGENRKLKDEIADGKSAKGYEPWKELQVQRQTLADVIRRFEGKQDCNIAILTGTALGVLAFDIDGEEALKHYDEIVEKLADNDISKAVKNTMQTKTGSSFGRGAMKLPTSFAITKSYNDINFVKSKYRRQLDFRGYYLARYNSFHRIDNKIKIRGFFNYIIRRHVRQYTY